MEWSMRISLCAGKQTYLEALLENHVAATNDVREELTVAVARLVGQLVKEQLDRVLPCAILV